MTTPTVKPKKKKRNKWRRRILIAISVIILLPTTLFVIGWFNRDTIIDSLQNRYNENNNGTLKIGKVNANFIGGFPNVGFTLKDIKQTNLDTIADKQSSVTIEEARLTIGARHLLSGNIKFKKIEIANAIITSEVVSNRGFQYHDQLSKDKNNQQTKGIQMPDWLHDNGVKFKLENVTYKDTDTILNKAFNIVAHNMEGNYKKDDLKFKGNLNFNITVNTLGFNTKKGSYFNGANVVGNPEFTIDLEKNTISLPEFLFKVDEQDFNLSANFDFTTTDEYAFKLKNETTNFEALKTLLPENIASKLLIYDIEKPLKTHLDLSGNFLYGNDPIINVDFSTENNTILLDKKFPLKNVSFLGHLTTDIYETDSLKTAKRTGYDLKISFKDLKAKVDSIDVNVNNGYYQSTPEAWNFVNANIQLQGSNASLAKLIDTDNFDFKGGTFTLDTQVLGDVDNMEQFANLAIGNFNLKNTRVVLKKNGLQLPIQTIDLDLNQDNSTLNKLVVNLPNGENLILKGKLKNISALLSKNPKTRTTSAISLNSKALNINTIIGMANQFVPKTQSTIENRKNLHESLSAVYSQFSPSFNINVDALTYNDVTINNLKSEIDLVSPEKIMLRRFDFDYQNAKTNLQGNVVVPKPKNNYKDLIFINANATSNGDIVVFQDLFNIKLFKLNSGNYKFNGKINGNIAKFNDLLNNAEGDFTLNNTKLNYTQANVDFDIEALQLFVNESNMYLKHLDLEIGELNAINLTGVIKQFPGFLLDEKPINGSVNLKIESSFIDSNKLISTLNGFSKKDKIDEIKSNTALYDIFEDINHFKPSIEIAVDSLKYKDLVTKDVNGLLYFKNDSLLKLKHLKFNYKQTKALITGEINAQNNAKQLKSNNPFDLDFLIDANGNPENLNDYFKTKNFNFKSGQYVFKGQYKAKSEDLKILNSQGFGDLKISNTLVSYKAAGLKVPVDSMHVAVNNNVATLETLDIDLPGKSEVYFSGEINQFSDFINNTKSDDGSRSNFSIYSPYLATEDVFLFLKNSNTEKVDTTTVPFNIKKFKKALVGINTSFYPTVNIKIDTLKKDSIALTNFKLNALFDAENNFKIKDTHLNFYGGTLNINVDVGTNNNTNIPAKIDLHAKNIDLNKLAIKFDYFSNEALKNADKIEGIINVHIDATGLVDYEGKLNMNSLNGIMTVDISQLQLHNFKLIMENSVLMKDERFKQLNFRPIVQTLQITNGEIIIPRTEIQSSAIHLFAEGRLKFNEYMNIWLSLPWKNLKSNDGLFLPEKTTFEKAGSKFYVQLVQDKTEKKEKNRDLKVKVRLSNRKLKKLKKKNFK